MARAWGRPTAFHAGDMPLEPSWYIIVNLLDSRKNDVLPGFHVFC